MRKFCGCALGPTRKVPELVLKRVRLRVIAIETSWDSCSVALVQQDQLVFQAESHETGKHAEHLLGLVNQALAACGWTRSSLDRVGVGTGPGSFTGLRVGMAFAEGMALGLARPIVGVGALRALARGIPSQKAGTRLVLLDAKKGEAFIAAYDEQGTELLAPEVCSHADAVVRLSQVSQLSRLPARHGASERWVTNLKDRLSLASSEAIIDIAGPNAHWVGQAAAELPPSEFPPIPIYIRSIGATLPNLRTSALAPQPESWGPGDGNPGHE